MEKLNSSMADGGVPMYETDFINLQNSLYLIVNQLINNIAANAASVGGGIILSGCDRLGTGPLHIDGGYVYLDGEYLSFSGYTGSGPCYIVADAAINESRIFKDGNTHTAVITKNAKAQTSAPGSGQYVLINDTSEVPFYFTLLRDGLFSNVAWNNLSLNSGYTTATVAQYRRINNTVTLQGSITIGAGAVGAVATALATPYRPPIVKIFLLSKFNSGTLTYTSCSMLTNGTILFFGGDISEGDIINLDSVRFEID